MSQAKPDRVDAQLKLSSAVLEWTARNAARASRQRGAEAAAQWAEIGGRITGMFGSSVLAHAEIEGLLRPAIGPIKNAKRSPAGGTLKWLHVLTESYRTGGHTALARRWIELDGSADRHDLVLTNQSTEEASPTLLDAVRQRGGTVTALPAQATSLTARAIVLQSLAAEADAVVLHVHPWDTLPLMAFGHPGGPPVYLVNHADHLFWFGGSIADKVLNIRPSGEALCARFRGVGRSLRMPLPLPEPAARVGDASGSELRLELGIPADAVVLLTIGSRFKFLPIEGFSFLDAAALILDRNPGTYLLAVGPQNDRDGWPKLREKFGSRVNAVGTKTDIQPYLAAANVYLEGFPFGSLTAMLEAVLAGLPPVLAPARCPLPYRSDDFGLDDLPVAEDVEAYAELAGGLIRDEAARVALSKHCGDRVRQLHCLPEWQLHVEALRREVAQCPKHQPVNLATVESMDPDRVRYWASFSMSGNSDNAFSAAFREALQRKLRPRVDRQLRLAMASASADGVPVANSWLAAVGSQALALLPNAVARRIYLAN